MKWTSEGPWKALKIGFDSQEEAQGAIDDVHADFPDVELQARRSTQ